MAAHIAFAIGRASNLDLKTDQYQLLLSLLIVFVNYPSFWRCSVVFSFSFWTVDDKNTDDCFSFNIQNHPKTYYVQPYSDVKMCNVLGPVVQSIVSLTKSLVSDSLSLLVRLKSLQKLLTFFRQKWQCFYV